MNRTVLNNIQLATVTAVAIAALLLLRLAFDGGRVHEWIIQFCCYGLFALSLNLLVGYGGMLAFGHAAFFGLGTYAFCLLLRETGMSIPVAGVLSVALVVAIAVPIGYVCVRLQGVFFSFITLAIQMLLYSLVLSWSGLTGGEQGLIGGIPRPVFMGVNLADPWHLYVFCVVVFAVCIAVMYRIVSSPFGAALRMIRDNPQRAAFVGLDIIRYRLGMFLLAALFASIAGILMALHVSGAYPNFMYWTLSGEGMFMIVLGGVSVFLGPLAGAAILIVINGLLHTVGVPHGLVLGTIILLMVLGFRKGLLEWAAELRFARRSRASNAVPAAPSSMVGG